MSKTVEFKYGLGDEVKDSITGFSGIVTGRVQYFTGCIAYQITPQLLNKEGEPHKSSVLNENGLVLIQEGKVKTGLEVAEESNRPRGGPSDNNLEDPSGR